MFAALAARAFRRLVAADKISDRLGIPVLGEVPALSRPSADPADMFQSGGDSAGSRRSSNSAATSTSCSTRPTR